MTDQQKDEGISAMERHGQTVLTAIVLAAILWVGTTILQQRDRLADLSTSIQLINAQVTVIGKSVEQFAADRYSASMARADFAERDQRIKELTDRMDNARRTIGSPDDIDARLKRIEHKIGIGR